MTPALLMTGSTDVQPACSRPVVKIRNRIRISTYQIRLCVNWFKVLQQVHVSLIVHLIVPLFFQRVVKEKLICNTNRFFLQELGGLWRESDCAELVGVTHRKRCWSWGKIFRQYRAILAQLRTGPETKYCDYSCGYHWRHEQRKTTTWTFH